MRIIKFKFKKICLYKFIIVEFFFVIRLVLTFNGKLKFLKLVLFLMNEYKISYSK